MGTTEEYWIEVGVAPRVLESRSEVHIATAVGYVRPWEVVFPSEKRNEIRLVHE